MSEAYSVSIGVSATGVEEAISNLQRLDELLNQINGKSVSVSVQLAEDVINRVSDVKDAINSINGLTSVASIEAANNVSDVIADVRDNVASLDGSAATITIEGNVEMPGGGSGGFGGGGSGNLFYDVFGNDSQYNSFRNGYNATRSAGNSFVNFADRFTSGLFRYGSKAAALAGGVGVGRVLGDYSNWEYQQAETEGVLDPIERTAENLAKLSEESMSYAEKGYTPLEVSQAQTELAKAGFGVGEISDILPAMLNIGNAGGLDLETSTLITSSALRSFSLEAKDAAHVSDVLAKAANATNADIEGLGESIKYSGSYANALNIPIESLTATLGVLSNYNIRNSQAGTTLRSVMSRLISPTDSAAKVMEKYNMNFIDGEGKIKDFAGIIETLNEGLGDLSSSEKAAAIKDIFGQTAIAGVLSLMNAGPEAIQQMTDALYDCDGAAQEMADIKLDTLMGQWNKFKGELSVTAIEIGNELAPMASDFLSYLESKLPDVKDKIIDIAKYLSEHSDSVAAFASGMVKLGGALVAISAASKIASAIGSISSLISALSSGVGLSGAVAAINPITAAIVGLGGAFAYLATTSESFRTDIGDSFSGLGDSIGDLKESLSGIDKALGGLLGKFGKFSLNGAGAGIVAFVDSLSAAIEYVSELITNLGTQLGGFKDIYEGYFKVRTGDIKEGFELMGDGISQVFDGGMANVEAAAEAGKKVGEAYTNAFKTAWNNSYTADAPSAFKQSKEQSDAYVETTPISGELADMYNSPNNLRKFTIEFEVSGQEEAIAATNEVEQNASGIPDSKSIQITETGSDEVIAKTEEVKNNTAEISDSQTVNISETGADETQSAADEVNSSVENIPTSHNTNITCSGAEAAASAAASVASAVNSIPSSKSVTITVSKVGSESVDENASGTDFFNGGLTTVAENGYEIVNFDKGTKIFSHGDSKQILNDYYKNQTALAKAAGAENQGYQVNKGASNGNVTYVSFAIQGGNTKEIVDKVAVQLTEALNSRA